MAGQLGFDPDYDKKKYRIERAGWIVMAITVLASALGLMGGGPFSDAHVAGRMITVRHSRFIRSTRDSVIHVRFTGVELRIRRKYLESFEIRSITPPPDSTYTSENDLVYKFAPSPRPETDVTISLRTRDLHFGWMECAIGNGREQIHFRQFVWP
jgi:hypothetical protein